MVGTEGTWGDKRTFRELVGKGEEKRPLGRPRFKWEDNIKLNLEETGRDLLDLIYVSIGKIGGMF
jgi:hypothetical protein